MRRALAALVGLALAGPALAVGLSPLGKDGITAGPHKAFYLTVINPYADAREFRVALDGARLDVPPGTEASPDLAILPALVTVKPGGQRRVVVILRNLAPGESRTTRVCAQLAKQEGMIHARVCSNLSARRLKPRGA